MNERAPLRLSFQSIPTSRARLPSARGRSARAGASLRHGSHQLAQKWITAGLPRRDASVARGGTNTWSGSAGAGRACVLLSELPLSNSAVINAATRLAAAPAAIQRRIALLGRQLGHVLDDV